MNCKQVEELMPLYLGHDLEYQSASLIAAHLQNCTACAGSALEYEQADQLLQQFEPPPFSDAAYAAVRHNVLREIQRKSSAPGLMAFFMRPLPLQVTWAVSAAVMVVVSVFAYYFLADRMSQQTYRPQLTANRDAGKKDPVDELVNTGTADAPSAPAPNSHQPRLNQRVWHSTRASGAPAASVRSAKYSVTEPKSANASTTSGNLDPLVDNSNHDRTMRTVFTHDHFGPSTHQQAGLYSGLLIEPTGSSWRDSETGQIVGRPTKTLRLEMQTKDPNIRIIWFSHPLTNEGSPTESSKGI